MRIVDVNEFYSPTGGGVRTYIDRKIGIMADLGHELTVIAPALEDGVEDRPGGGRILWVKSPALLLDKNYCIFVKDEPVWELLDQLQAKDTGAAYDHAGLAQHRRVLGEQHAGGRIGAVQGAPIGRKGGAAACVRATAIVGFKSMLSARLI